MTPQQFATAFRMVRYGLPMARLKPSSRYTVADIIETQAKRRGDHPFVLFENRTLSYRDYNATANRLAHLTLSLGIRAGDVVALLMQNRLEYPVVWGGLSKIGVTTALLNTNLVDAQLAHAIEAAGSRHVIVGSECLESWQTLDAQLRSRLGPWGWRDPSQPEAALPEGAVDLDAALAEQLDTNPDPSVRSEVRFGDPHVYIYTSGTTGLPKAARMSHLRFSATGLAAQIAGFGPDDVMYCALPLYHSAGGAMAVTAALRSGGTVAVRRKFSARRFWDDVRDYRATAFQYIGEFCRYLLNQPPDARDGEHELAFGIGNGLRPDIWTRFQERFAIPRLVEFYGATEGNVAMVNYDNKVGSVGKRPPAFLAAPRLIRYDVAADVHVRNDQGLCIECKADEVGELVGEIPQKTDSVQGRFEGYTSKKDTDKKILRDVVRPGDSWFRTGDLLKCDKDGYYYFVDRIGDTFRWKGENVSTQAVAEAIGSYPGLEMCNVYGVELGEDGRAGMAALLLSDPSRFDGSYFFELVARTLPAYAQPVFVRLRPEEDVTGTFKLRKVDLQREGFDPAQLGDPIFVRDEEARTYVELTRERLEALRSGQLRV